MAQQRAKPKPKEREPKNIQAFVNIDTANHIAANKSLDDSDSDSKVNARVSTQSSRMSEYTDSHEHKEPWYQRCKWIILPKSKALFTLRLIRLVVKLYIAILEPIRIPYEEVPHEFWVSTDMII